MTHRANSLYGRLKKAAISAVFGVSAILAGTQAFAQDTISLRLDWLPSGYHAPLFYGLAKGFYSDVGIDLVIADGKGTNVALQSVATGNDLIGLANYATMLAATDRDLPVIGIGGLIQKLPDAIISLEGSNIKSAEDLVGKSIATAGTSATVQLLMSYLANEKGIDTSKINIVQTDASAFRATLLQRQVDAIAAWALSDALLVAKEAPIDPPLLFPDMGVNMLGTGFVASKNTVETQGDVLRRFMAATNRAYTEAFENPEAAAEALAAARPAIDVDTVVKQIKLLPDFLWTANSAGHAVGWTAREDWELTARLLKTYSNLQKEVDLDAAYTNEFVAD